MKIGAVHTISNSQGVTLARQMLDHKDQLSVDWKKCIGCEICSEICPRQAIKVSSEDASDGQGAKAHIDQGKCSFCGLCAATCLSQAISQKVNEEDAVPILVNQLYPGLQMEFEVNKACREDCQEECRNDCPRQCLEVEHSAKEGQAYKKVSVDTDSCLYCGKCQSACPHNEIKVERPILAEVKINNGLCPQGCTACSEVCPTGALAEAANQAAVCDSQYCIGCGACRVACSSPGALELRRIRILPAGKETRLWLDVVNKLLGSRRLKRVLAGSALRNRQRLIDSRLV